MGSDHTPMLVTLMKLHDTQRVCSKTQQVKNNNRYYNKANWEHFSESFRQQNFSQIIEVNNLNEKITKAIITAWKLSIPLHKTYRRNDNEILPKYILELITHHKTLKANKKKSELAHLSDIKKNLNELSKIIRREIAAFKNNNGWAILFCACHFFGFQW